MRTVMVLSAAILALAADTQAQVTREGYERGRAVRRDSVERSNGRDNGRSVDARRDDVRRRELDARVRREREERARREREARERIERDARARREWEERVRREERERIEREARARREWEERMRRERAREHARRRTDDDWWESRRDRDDRWVLMRRGNGQGPAYCRSGAGHPVHGRQWCVYKGYGLGNDRWDRVRWDDVIFRRAYWQTNTAFGRDGLIDILGSTVFGRLDARRRFMGVNAPLTGRWFESDNRVVMLVSAGGWPLAELVDLNRDRRVDFVLVNLDR